MDDQTTPLEGDAEQESPSEAPPFDPDPRLITKLERGRREDERRFRLPSEEHASG
jgi:hypothetical protein